MPLSDIPRRFFTVFPLKDIRDLRFREKGLSMKLRALVFGARFRTFKCWWHYRKTPGYQRPWVYASVTRFCNLFGRSWGKRLRVPRNRVRTAQV